MLFPFLNSTSFCKDHSLLIRDLPGSKIIRLPLKSSSEKSLSLFKIWRFIASVDISLGKCATTIPKCLPSGNRRILPKPVSPVRTTAFSF